MITIHAITIHAPYAEEDCREAEAGARTVGPGAAAHTHRAVVTEGS